MSPDKLLLNQMDINLYPPYHLFFDQIHMNLRPLDKLSLVQTDINLCPPDKHLFD